MAIVITSLEKITVTCIITEKKKGGGLNVNSTRTITMATTVTTSEKETKCGQVGTREIPNAAW